MEIKKEFDIDTEFFTEEERPSKRKLGLKIFIVVLILSFLFFLFLAFKLGLFNKDFTKGFTFKNNDTVKTANDYFLHGVASFESNELDKALEFFTKELEMVDDPDAYLYLAKINIEQNKLNDAVLNFQNALKIKPDFQEAMIEFAKLYLSMNDYKNSSVYFEKALEFNQNDYDTMLLAAEAYKKSGKVKEAENLYLKILELNPADTFSNMKLGELYFDLFRFNEAIKNFENALMFLYDENTALKLSKSYFETGEIDSAMKYVNLVIKNNPNNKQALSLKRTLEYKAGLNGEEIKKIEEKETLPKKNELPPLNPEVVKSYIGGIEPVIKLNWTPPMGSNLKKAVIKFKINSSGELVSSYVESPSGSSEFDKSCLDAINASIPFPPLPNELGREELDILFTFDYNIAK